MNNFIYRKGKVRIPKQYTVILQDEQGKQLYERKMVTGIIKNMPNYVSTVLDGMIMFDRYEDCGFGDLDMVAQINGHMLNIEFKGSFHKLLNGSGQLEMAINLAETSKVTTIFVEGTPDNPQRLFSISHVQSFNDYEVREVNGVDGLNLYIRQWRDYAYKSKDGADNKEKLETVKKALKAQLKGGKRK